ncbi:FAD-dependent oxidoreductase, partial [bacterium]|nr:FAD-dependent oxidoreductase [bacterium]
GCEFASIFSSFGTKVTVIEALDKLLGNLDNSLTDAVTKLFKRQKVNCLLNTKVSDLKEQNGKISATINGEQEEFDKVLQCTGFKADFIDIDEYCRTKNKNIYAIGDITGKSFLAHTASHQAYVAVSHIVNNDKDLDKKIDNIKMDYSAIPSVIFTHPEIASVGQTEAQAVKECEIKTFEFPFMASGRAKTMGESMGFVKIIADKKTDIVKGIHIFGAGASELIGESTVYVQNKMKAKDIYHVIHAHPTLNEAIMEAGLGIDGLGLHI